MARSIPEETILLHFRNMAKLILMRHGKSEWNAKNLFTGWVDVPLNEQGVQEAIEGGKKIKDIPIDLIFTSTLIRAHTTLTLSMMHHSSKKVPIFIHPENEKIGQWSQIYSEKTKESCIPVYCSWHLNERMYGKLQGLNKQETREKFGENQVHIWRRSYKTAPPDGESLEMTKERTVPYFEKEILPYLEKGKNVYICAHGNSLRSIIMHLESISEEEIPNLEIATGSPIIYTYENKTWTKHPSS